MAQGVLKYWQSESIAQHTTKGINQLSSRFMAYRVAVATENILETHRNGVLNIFKSAGIAVENQAEETSLCTKPVLGFSLANTTSWFPCETATQILSVLVCLWNKGYYIDFLSLWFPISVGNEKSSAEVLQRINGEISKNLLPSVISLPPLFTLPQAVTNLLHYLPPTIDAFTEKLGLHHQYTGNEEIYSVAEPISKTYLPFLIPSCAVTSCFSLYFRLLLSTATFCSVYNRSFCPRLATYVESDFFTLDSLSPIQFKSAYYNYFACLVPESLDKLRFREAFVNAIELNDALRTRFWFSTEANSVLCATKSCKSQHMGYEINDSIIYNTEENGSLCHSKVICSL